VTNFHERRPWFGITTAYLLAYSPMFFLGNYRLWDDWTSHSFNGVAPMLSQVFPLRYALDNFLIGLTNNFWMYRPITVTSFFVSGWAVWKILEVPRGLLSREQRYWITILFLVLPYNSVRVSLHVLFSYTYSHLLFFVAWYLLVTKRQLWWCGISLVLFFLSFPTQSLLFYVVLPAAHCLFCSDLPIGGRLIRFVSLGLLSIFYRPISGYLWPSNHYHEGYNEIRVEFVTRGLMVLGFGAATALILWRAARNREPGSDRTSLALVAVGVLAFVCGIFPYMAVGHFPNVSDLLLLFVPNWGDVYSRHSLLLPLGTSLAIVGFISLVVREPYRTKVLSLCLACCMILCLSIYSQYVVDYRKQSALVHKLSGSENQVATRFVQFKDQAWRMNARGRLLYPWEYLGILQMAGQGYDFAVTYDDFAYGCSEEKEVAGTLITFDVDSGRLRILATGEVGLVLTQSRVKNLCGPGVERLPVHQLQASD